MSVSIVIALYLLIAIASTGLAYAERIAQGDSKSQAIKKAVWFTVIGLMIITLAALLMER